MPTGCRAAVGKRLGLRNKIRRLPYRGVFAKGRGTAFDAQRKDFSDKLPELAQAIGRLSNGRALVLDGEAIISDDEGRSDFQALQNHLRLKDGRKPVYMVFDLLSLDGKDLRELPLEERKKG